MNDFNLLVSSSRFREEDACNEILDLLDSFGDQNAEAEITEVKGIILAKTALDPLQVVSNLKKLTADEPWEVRYVMRVMPVQRRWLQSLKTFRAPPLILPRTSDRPTRFA